MLIGIAQICAQEVSPVKRVVSVSLGSSSRNSVGDAEFLGQKVRMERIGTDGDMQKLLSLLRELDGQVDAIGTGGIKRKPEKDPDGIAGYDGELIGGSGFGRRFRLRQ